MKNVGHRLRALREQRGWTQKQTAEQLGLCTRCAIGQFERLERNPAEHTLKALADLFEVTPEWILTGGDSPDTAEPILEAQPERGFRINGKPKERYPVSLYPDTVAKVKKLAKENGISVAEAFDQIVEYAISNLVE